MTEPQIAPPNGNSNPNPNPTKKTVAPWMTLAVEVVAAVAALGYMLFKHPELLKTIFIFLVTLGVLVFVHEWGHYQFARWAGMKVNRFAIGFPPFIYTKRRNNIDYSIGALPIGGMVDIAGLGSEEEMVNSAKGEVSTPKRDTSRPFGQRQFQDGNLFWRFMVLFAGPLMNFLLAIVTFIGVYSIAGVPEVTAPVKIGTVVAGAPAAEAGLKAGDEIVTFDGQPTRNPDFFSNAIRGGATAPRTFGIKRGTQQLNVQVTPAMRDLNHNGIKVPSIGVAFAGVEMTGVSYLKLAPLAAVEKGFQDSIKVSTQILDVIKRALTRNLSKEEANGIGGPIKIAQTVGQASAFGLPILLQFAASLSVNLGLMNLLPLPALDGGRIMFLGYELVARRPFNPRWEGMAHAAGMILLLAFMLFITLRDVASL